MFDAAGSAAHVITRNNYTYADYLAWDEEYRAEIIDGEVMEMPAPGRRHQQISWNLAFQIAAFINGKPYKAYTAPFSVRLFAQAGERDTTVLEPDIAVISDPSKLDDRGCIGAPDLIIEILSPSSFRHDNFVKFNKYLQAGVREYWLVDPDATIVDVNVLKDGHYVHTFYDETATAVPVSVLPGCTIDLKAVFAE
jgi:Uma2 family endonuclease